VKEKKENQVHVFDYSPSTLEEKNTNDINECIPYKDTNTVTWINVDSAPPIHFLEKLRLGFELHPVIENDILATQQRPKLEVLDKYLFFRTKMMRVDAMRKIHQEQISMVVAQRFLLTFQEGVKGDTFEPVRTLIRNGEHRIRKHGTDYLCYELIDSVVDGYFEVLELCSTRIDEVEREIVRDINPKSLRALDSLRRELMTLRKTAWPMREIITNIERDSSTLIKSGTQIYFRNVFTKLVQVTENIDTYREMISSLQDFYHMKVNGRTNEVMKFLTVITTIFMPLTLFVGYFGSNFTHLPFIDSPYAPGASLLAMAGLVVAMLAYFKYKQWL
jgi:magnesium transporter